MLQWDRTEYDKGFRKTFHVCPNGSTIADELARKYGADYVWVASSTSASVAINRAIGAATGSGNEVIYLYPGTYTLAATISVNKNVKIRGAGDNPNAVIINALTGTVTAFTFTAAGDYAQIENLTISADYTTPSDAIIVPASCPGVVIKNVTINGDDTAATVGIDSESDYLVVDGCRFYGVHLPVQSLGTKCKFVNNHIVSSTASSVGIDMQDGDFHEVGNNTFDVLSGTTTACVKIGTAAKCNQVTFYGNRYNTAASANITNGNTSTLGQYGDIVSDVTTAVWATV